MLLVIYILTCTASAISPCVKAMNIREIVILVVNASKISSKATDIVDNKVTYVICNKAASIVHKEAVKLKILKKAVSPLRAFFKLPISRVNVCLLSYRSISFKGRKHGQMRELKKRNSKAVTLVLPPAGVSSKSSLSSSQLI